MQPPNSVLCTPPLEGCLPKHPHHAAKKCTQYYNYTVSQKRCHPNHGYNFVSSWSICKILSLLQRTVNFQQNSY